MYKDFPEFLAKLEASGQLVRIKTQVSAHLEITEIADRVSKSQGPALLFENVVDSPFPLVINAFGSPERMALALGVDKLDVIAQRIEDLIRMPPFTGFWDKLRNIPRVAQLGSIFPKRVKTGPCKDVIIKDKPSLAQLPILHCWPLDGGPFLTLPLVITKDPLTGQQNMGMYRMQVYDNYTTGMHWHLHKDGARHYQIAKEQNQPLEVAVALGGDPATIYAATAPLPQGIDEILFAGFLRRSPVELVKAETLDLWVPAQAEFILEGYVDPNEFRAEGPFGDHTGYYSLIDEYPVFHLTCLTHRKNPIYPATVVGKPPMEDCYLGKATERLFLPLMRLQLPEIVDLNLPLEGVFHNCAIVSIKKAYPGHARKVIYALWGLGQMMFTKIIIVVEAAVNIQDLSELAWKVFNNVDPQRDLVITQGPLDALDHASPTRHYGGKLGIDATIKWPEEGQPRVWPPEIKMSQDIRKTVDQRWKEYGIAGFTAHDQN